MPQNAEFNLQIMHVLLSSFPGAVDLQMYIHRPPGSHHLAPYALHQFTVEPLKSIIDF